MEIDPVEVAILAIASIIGATAMALAWAGFARALNIRRRVLISFAFLVMGSVSGIAFLFEPLVNVLAAPLVRILPDPVYLELARKDPLLDRLARDHPEVLSGLEARVIAAHMMAGEQGARAERERFGVQRSAGVTSQYFARARAEDLGSLMEMQGAVFVDLETRAPELCYPFLFGLEAGDAVLSARMDTEIPVGLESHTRSLILNAGDVVPAFDRGLGQSVIRSAQVDVALEHGAHGVALMSGDARPRTREEAEALCAVYSDFFAAVTSQGPERADAAWRSMFVAANDS